jgi:hypothetical protein
MPHRVLRYQGDEDEDGTAPLRVVHCQGYAGLRVRVRVTVPLLQLQMPVQVVCAVVLALPARHTQPHVRTGD